MADDDARPRRGALAAPHGAILSTGPTGSGKTTTLYAALGVVSTPRRRHAIEDPVEYRLPASSSRCRSTGAPGSTFASGLRSIVRADPDIIMVGEIRDRESARSRSRPR